MTTRQPLTKPRRRRASGIVFVATVVALGVGMLTQPAASNAEAVWDVGAFDGCMKAARKSYGSHGDLERYADEIVFCCQTSGGEWSITQGCTAPPVTAPPPQSPVEVIQAPGTGTATQDSPVGDVQPPAPAPATPTTKRYSPGWGI